MSLKTGRHDWNHTNCTCLEAMPHCYVSSPHINPMNSLHGIWPRADLMLCGIGIVHKICKIFQNKIFISSPFIILQEIIYQSFMQRDRFIYVYCNLILVRLPLILLGVWLFAAPQQPAGWLGAAEINTACFVTYFSVHRHTASAKHPSWIEDSMVTDVEHTRKLLFV